MSESKDPVMNLLAKRFERLPDLNDGITYREAMAMGKIINLAKTDNEAKSLLENIAKKEARITKFSPSLQGLLWMAEEKKEINKETLKRYSPEELVNYAYEQLPQRLKTPKDIFNFIITNFSYDAVGIKNSIRAAKETFADKGGDCKNISGFEYEFLKKIGYNPKILYMVGGNFYYGGHVICYYNENEKLFTIEGSGNILRIAMARKTETQRRILEAQAVLSSRKPRIEGPFSSLTELLHIYKATQYIVYDSFEEYRKDSSIPGRIRSLLQPVPPR